MNHDTTPTPRTEIYILDPLPPCVPAEFACDLERELADKTNEVARLKEIVMDAAKRGDEMTTHWKERAEKAEAIIKQLHHYAGIIEGFQTTDK